MKVFAGVGFISLREPSHEGENDLNWRVECSPALCAVNQMDFDVVVGAEGKHVTVPGFERREFRGKLAIAITANFDNKHTTAEAIVEEISGVAFVYKQDFFNSLYEDLGIALENIVYYKDETHYFVMTTKKHSLLDRGVLKKVVYQGQGSTGRSARSDTTFCCHQFQSSVTLPRCYADSDRYGVAQAELVRQWKW